MRVVTRFTRQINKSIMSTQCHKLVAILLLCGYTLCAKSFVSTLDCFAVGSNATRFSKNVFPTITDVREFDVLLGPNQGENNLLIGLRGHSG